MDNKERVKNKKKKFRKIVKWTKGKNISQYLISMSFVLFIMIVFVPETMEAWKKVVIVMIPYIIGYLSNKVEFPERKVYWEEI